MLDKISLKVGREYAVLVAIILPHQTESEAMEALRELELLAETAGVVCVKKVTQRLDRPHSKTFIGSGKLKEISEYAQARPEVTMIIFDDDLSGSQFSAIESALKIRVVDRSMLILDIFAIHAKTARSKTQVEMAQYKYLLPRLRGMWKHLERQGGGIGSRGPGEKELETDRRIVQQKIALLADKLKKIERQGETQRKNRRGLFQAALSGYTNAGKTAIMNSFTKESLASEDKLFVTLDTTTRKISLENKSFLLSDTVGFIQKIPHHLIESFKTTLEEVCAADLVLHVVDISHKESKRHFKLVSETLRDIGVDESRIIMALNKLDVLIDQEQYPLSAEDKDLIQKELKQEWEELTGKPCFLISAHKGYNMDELRSAIWKSVK